MIQTFLFPDPVIASLAVLRAGLAASTDPVATGASVGEELLFEEESPIAKLPYVAVQHEGSRLTDRVTEATIVRVVVWHTSKARGLALAQLCRSILLVNTGNQIRVVTSLIGPTPTTDPSAAAGRSGTTQGRPLSFFTLSVRTRPTTTI